MQFQTLEDRKAWIMFCAAALTGLVRSEKQSNPTHIVPGGLAEEAAAIADATLVEENKGHKEGMSFLRL